MTDAILAAGGKRSAELLNLWPRRKPSGATLSFNLSRSRSRARPISREVKAGESHFGQ